MINGGFIVYKYFSVAFVVVLIDQLTKWLVVKNMELGERIAIWDPWFGFLSHRNRGAAWGMLQGKMWLFYIITIAVIVGILYVFFTEGKNKPFLQFSLMILLGGAIGNFIDRVFRGEVVDFVDTFIPIIDYHFPIFNVADMALTVSVFLVFIAVLMDEGKEKVKK